MYEVPFDKKSIEQDQYLFKIGSKIHKVKKAKHLNGREAIAVASGNLAAMYDIFGADGTPTGDAVRDLPIEAFNGLVEDWSRDSGVTLGESPAS